MISQIYDPSIYNFNYVYSFFKSKKILHTQIRCSFCKEYMKIINDKSFLDNICFRCRKTNPKHDLKLSIRTGSFIENVRINLIAVYFLLINCFIFNLSSNKAAIEYNKLKEELNIGNVSIQNIQKFFRTVRNKIKSYTHLEWKKKF